MNMSTDPRLVTVLRVSLRVHTNSICLWLCDFFAFWEKYRATGWHHMEWPPYWSCINWTCMFTGGIYERSWCTLMRPRDCREVSNFNAAPCICNSHNGYVHSALHQKPIDYVFCAFEPLSDLRCIFDQWTIQNISVALRRNAEIKHSLFFCSDTRILKDHCGRGN